MSAQSKFLVEATERSRVEVNTTSWTQGVGCDTLLNLSRYLNAVSYSETASESSPKPAGGSHGDDSSQR